jgi:alkylated DNA repair dioxygenase AlkB
MDPWYQENVLSNNETYEKVKNETMTEYFFRGKQMKRAPKREYYYPGNENKVYKWGQQKKNYPKGENYTGVQMPDWMIQLADQIYLLSNERVNHAIIIRYDDGKKTHAPPHKDKIPDYTSFFVFSFGNPRMFQFLSTKMEYSQKTGKVKETVGDIIWEKKLKSNSLLWVTNQQNKDYFHAVPKDKNWNGIRYSLIFRTIHEEI